MGSSARSGWAARIFSTRSAIIRPYSALAGLLLEGPAYKSGLPSSSWKAPVLRTITRPQRYSSPVNSCASRVLPYFFPSISMMLPFACLGKAS